MTLEALVEHIETAAQAQDLAELRDIAMELARQVAEAGAVIDEQLAISRRVNAVLADYNAFSLAFSARRN